MSRIVIDPNTALSIHAQLHETHRNTVTVMGSAFRIVHRNDANRLFNMVTVQGVRFVTQNMRKNSTWTRWIQEDPDNRCLTWWFEPDDNGYSGKISTELIENKLVFKVEKFYRGERGDQVILEQSVDLK